MPALVAKFRRLTERRVLPLALRELYRCPQKALDWVKGLHTMVEGGFYDGIQASSGAYKHYCAGIWSESTSGRTVPVINPSTQSECYRVQGEHLVAAAALPPCGNCRCCCAKVPWHYVK